MADKILEVVHENRARSQVDGNQLGLWRNPRPSSSDGHVRSRSTSMELELKKAIACIAEDVSDLWDTVKQLQGEGLQVAHPAVRSMEVHVLSSFEAMERRINNLESVQGHPRMMSSAASSNPVGAVPSLKVVEQRLDRLEAAVAQIMQTDHASLKNEVTEIQKWRGQLDAKGDGLHKRGLKLSASKKWSMEQEAADVSPSVNAKTDPGLISEKSLMNTLNATIRKNRRYEFQESVYDAFFFIFIGPLDIVSNLLLLLSFFLNTLMQIGVLYIIAAQFIDPPYTTDDITRFRNWRLTSSHDFRNVDESSGTSLAARVCNQDVALSLATSQITAVSQVRAYLTTYFGQSLSTIAVMLWWLCCANELRQSIDFILGLAIVPRGQRCTISGDLEGLRILEISCVRLVVGLTVALFRFFMAAILMIYGALWLIHEDSILDLLLNASALSFVLDIDETIFGVLASLTVQGLISSITPLRLPVHRAITQIPVAFIISIFVFIISMNLTLLRTDSDRMEIVKEILCSDKTNLDLVFGSNALGWLTFADSVQYMDAPEDVQKVVEAKREVGQLLIDGHPDAEVYAYRIAISAGKGNTFDDVYEVGTVFRQTLYELGENKECVDEKMQYSSTNVSTLGARLWVATGNEAFKNISDCAQAKQFCFKPTYAQTGRNARFMCPHTCGCDDPLSGLVDLVSGENGCPERLCIDKILYKLQKSDHYPCEDTNISVLSNHNGWNEMTQTFVGFTDNQTLDSEFREKGCGAFARMDTEVRDRLCVIEGKPEMLGAATFCPISCGCLDQLEAIVAPTTGIVEIKQSGKSMGMCPKYSCSKLKIETTDRTEPEMPMGPGSSTSGSAMPGSASGSTSPPSASGMKSGQTSPSSGSMPGSAPNGSTSGSRMPGSTSGQGSPPAAPGVQSDEDSSSSGSMPGSAPGSSASGSGMQGPPEGQKPPPADSGTQPAQNPPSSGSIDGSGSSAFGSGLQGSPSGQEPPPADSGMQPAPNPPSSTEPEGFTSGSGMPGSTSDQASPPPASGTQSGQTLPSSGSMPGSEPEGSTSGSRMPGSTSDQDSPPPASGSTSGQRSTPAAPGVQSGEASSSSGSMPGSAPESSASDSGRTGPPEGKAP